MGVPAPGVRSPLPGGILAGATGGHEVDLLQCTLHVGVHSPYLAQTETRSTAPDGVAVHLLCVRCSWDGLEEGHATLILTSPRVLRLYLRA